MISTSNIPDFAGSLGQDYYYKSAVTQIPGDARLGLNSGYCETQPQP
jgi:hypothetical protein